MADQWQTDGRPMADLWQTCGRPMAHDNTTQEWKNYKILGLGGLTNGLTNGKQRTMRRRVSANAPRRLKIFPVKSC